MTPQAFSTAVLNWFDQFGRKTLPWQQDISPYRVWVSEIMLQQTQVATVLGYFSRFVERFPDVYALAAAPEDEVLHLWTGLGYYSRARNLHKTARWVVSEYGGVFPCSVAELTDLPGIGRSTAGAIASIAMGIRAPILDGNVKRVLARYLAQEGYPGDPAVSRQLWAVAENLTPTERVNDYTQAMMDLGATLCTRSKPRCGQCPLQGACKAHLQGKATAYPQPKPRVLVPVKKRVMPLFICGQSVLLYRRPSSGIWGGLWSLPELESVAGVPEWAAQHQLRVEGEPYELEPLVHRLTHLQLEIVPYRVQVSGQTECMVETGWVWYNLNAPPSLGLAAPVKKLLARAAQWLQAGVVS